MPHIEWENLWFPVKIFPQTNPTIIRHQHDDGLKNQGTGTARNLRAIVRHLGNHRMLNHRSSHPDMP